MYVFTSVNSKFTMYGKPINGVPEYTVKFEPVGSVGRFATNDEELAEKLRGNYEFGKKFMEIGVNVKENPKIVQGIRSSETHPELGKESLNPQDLIEFGKLQVTLLKSDGSYRKDASEENKLKYEALRKQLGEFE